MPNRPPKARTGIRYQICWPWVRWPLKTAARKSICFGVYGHGFPAGSPAGPHGESFLMHKSTTPELHAPDPAPTSIEDHVVALVIADRLGHSESSIRGFDHEPHLRYIPAMLAAFSATQHRALFCLFRSLGAALRAFHPLRVTSSRPRSRWSHCVGHPIPGTKKGAWPSKALRHCFCPCFQNIKPEEVNGTSLATSVLHPNESLTGKPLRI